MFTSLEQARGKWCPFVRVEGSNRFNNTLTDGFANTRGPYHCIADECMMWRGVHGHLKHGVQEALSQHGYCGLSAKPEYD